MLCPETLSASKDNFMNLCEFRLVFQMVEAEEEYTEQMGTLVSCFLRPFKMAASSKRPPCSHEDVNSIFLNSETVLFLHQIFLKGLTSRMESWPTLVLGDLFDMLLPMLSIYQEYVRNHHYSLQVLTECKQSAPSFAALLSRLENKMACRGRSLETFLTYPMHQVPRYIITLHEVLAHTPHDHVERKSLQNARQQLEDLSRQIHDEVSETENLRKNLAVERMIVEGCDILLDVNQVFVRQGTLIQIVDKPRGVRGRLSATFGSKASGDKEVLRQCFLFSNHLILTTRQSDDDGRLNLVPAIGKIPLSDAILIEDPSDPSAADDDELSVCSMSSGISESSGSGSGGNPLGNRDFKITLDMKSGGPPISLHLLATTMQEKAAWVSDISQCMDNVHFNDLLRSSLSDTSSVPMPQSVRNDPKLFKDDVDIRFSRTLNSCKLPQIRYATPEKLLQRLTDLRFLSIDFLNTFLLTYRVFTDGVTVLEALKKVFYEAEPPDGQMPCGSLVSLDCVANLIGEGLLHVDDRRRSSFSPRRTSGASSISGYGSEISDCRDVRSQVHFDSVVGAQMASSKSHWRTGYRKLEEEQPLGLISELPPIIKESPILQLPGSLPGKQSPKGSRRVSIKQEDSEEDGSHLTIPKVIKGSSSSETLIGDIPPSNAPSSPSNLSSVTLIGSTGSESGSGSDPSPQDGNVTYSGTLSEERSTSTISEMTSKYDIHFTYEDYPHPSPMSPRVTVQSKSMRPPHNQRRNSEKDYVWTDEESTSSNDFQFNFQQIEKYSQQHRASVVSAPTTSMRTQCEDQMDDHGEDQMDGQMDGLATLSRTIFSGGTSSVKLTSKARERNIELMKKRKNRMNTSRSTITKEAIQTMASQMTPKEITRLRHFEKDHKRLDQALRRCQKELEVMKKRNERLHFNENWDGLNMVQKVFMEMQLMNVGRKPKVRPRSI
ncbi:ras-specific guanine nucleotide-releasing factor 2 [Diachasma alloeum]|uniref:ras-specific guanine nucleotide-releasing factor 2 n=1 Tax=Diachasma alloeum TaxID=454923 RepID=UPI0007382A4C|nr:ras-specific guanine nucleotide-releasing factor 2 [Diachasma alloeum]